MILSSLACIGLMACGGSTSSGDDGNNKTDNQVDAAAPPSSGIDASIPPPADGGLTPTDAAHSDAGDDGGDDPYGPYPAAHPPLPLMVDQGGGVITDPKVVTVTFVGNANRDSYRTFNQAIIASDYWDSITRGYGIHRGTATAVELPDSLAGKTLDNDKDLKPWVAQMVADGSLPAPDANTIYALYFSKTTKISLTDPSGTTTSCNGFAGYHDSASVKLADGSTVDAAFAVFPVCGGGVSDDTVTHELIEAVTDPHPASQINQAGFYMWDDAWSLFGTGGGEVADNCQSRGPFTTPDGHSVTRSYVNAAAKESKDPCQPTDPGKIYFGAAPVTETQTFTDPNDATSNHESGNYIVLKAGQSKDVDITVFSEAKLPHELTIVAGASGQSQDPTQVGTIATGVTAKLSQTTGHNGDHIKLTLTAAANASQGDHNFVTRAVLEQDDYHSWWVILRVTK